MKSKKMFGILSSVILSTSVLLAGCGGGQESAQPQSGGAAESAPKAETHTLKLATVFGTDHPLNVALREKFKPIVEEKSGGTLKVDIYDNNKLGAEKEIYDGVRNGTVEMAVVSTVMAGDVEKMAVGDWPFLMKDVEHAKKVFTGPIGEEIAKELESKVNVQVLAWSANGFKAFSSNSPIKSMEDFKGLRLRMPNNPTYIKVGEAMGANVTPMPLSEVFTALEQKVVDGQDNALATVRANGFYEVQSDILESNHIFSPLEHIVSDKLWKKLTPDQQKILEDAAVEAANYEWELYAKSLEEDKKFLQEKGVQFTTPDDKFRADMEAAVKPLYDEIYSKYPWAKEMVEKIKAEAK
ncbi:TRAP transporter substrate-binding protein [Ammoniphilus sp. 3BR4]|uniref:TRAP transporter substrate-binding protein n=1 Tax=Ammoniphilus sp. 3BR4 TaxID=3158265 RepID=UPI00346731E4